MKNILLKTTIEYADNDWCIDRFSLLKKTLEHAGFVADCRNRSNNRYGDDTDLELLPMSDYDELWLLAIEGDDGGLTKKDVINIDAFRRRGKGCMFTRDHTDVGCSLIHIPEIGDAHHFHSVNPEPNHNRRQRDDTYNADLDWPNYHSGLNGDIQEISILSHGHPLIDVDGKSIRYFPAHPHEGAISVPKGMREFAMPIAQGRSKLSKNNFDLVIAFEGHSPVDNPEQYYGRVVLHSSFHHFADYNWNTQNGCPNFVSEPTGSAMADTPEAQEDIRNYCVNLARWLCNDI